MNPGLVVKLRPTGPWRIGPDSGARNKVDAIYHSDSLYAAVTSVMARLGSIEEWLDATARAASPAVCFSSCFPFLDEIGFVTPPRTVWPPSSPAQMSARVRWKSARFVPLGIVQAILAGERLNDREWAVDGPSECLVPDGRPGPFRMGLRWNAAVDRLTGASERHSTACVEFRAGAGLWTIVSFADEAARDRWMAPVKAAFRWLADSGFGGERSRGWGRSEAPEFVEGTLPEMILGAGAGERGPGAGEAAAPPEKPAPAPVEEPPAKEPPVTEPPAPEENLGEGAGESAAPPVEGPPVEEPPVTEPPAPEENPAAGQAEVPEALSPEEPAPLEQAMHRALDEFAPLTAPHEESVALQTAEISALTQSEAPAPMPEETSEHAPVEAAEPTPDPQPPTPEETPEAAPVAAAAPPAPGPRAPVPSFWLLSLFTPAAEDTVDWGRGNYTLVTRGGRVDRSGELKKQMPMVAEGSVLHAASAPRGSASDVAPDGAAHPVFRAGFAVSIPLGEVS